MSQAGTGPARPVAGVLPPRAPVKARMLYRQTLLYLPAQALGPALQLVSIVAWTYFLGAQEMGVLALVTAAQELVYTASLSWFSYFTMRYHDSSGSKEERQRFLNTEAGALLAASLVAALSVPLLAWTIEAKWTPGLIAATLTYTVSRGIATQLADRARTAHDALSYSILQIVWPLGGLLLGLALVALWKSTAEAVLWGYAIAQIAAIAAALIRLDIGRHPFALDRNALRQGLVYGLPLVAGTALIWVASNGLRFVVDAMQGAAAVGLMTVGWGLGQRASAFAAMLVTAAAFPLAMRRAREEGFESGQAQLVTNGVLLFAALAPVTAGLWAITEPLVGLAVAAPFREITTEVLPLALVGGAVRNFRMHFGEQVFMLHARPTIPLYNDLFDAFATLGLAALGLTFGGIAGAVAGAAIGATLSLAVTLYCGWLWYGFTLPLAHMRAPRFVGVIACASFIAASAASFSSNVAPSRSSIPLKVVARRASSSSES